MGPSKMLDQEMSWLFTEEGWRQLLTQPHPHIWTEKEDGILSKYFPNYPEIAHRLPHRTYKACKHRARLLGLCKKHIQWSDEETLWLKRNYATASWGKMLENLPRRTVGGIKARAHILRLYRQKPEMHVYGSYILEQIRSKAKELNFSMADLDAEAGTYAYFRHIRKKHWPIYLRMDAIDAAVRAMGGRIVIQWADE